MIEIDAADLNVLHPARPRSRKLEYGSCEARRDKSGQHGSSDSGRDQQVGCIHVLKPSASLCHRLAQQLWWWSYHQDLLIRSSMFGHPDPFRSVRDLGRAAARCSSESGELVGRSSAWLPGWLPAAHDTRHRDALVLVTSIGRSRLILLG